MNFLFTCSSPSARLGMTARLRTISRYCRRRNHTSSPVDVDVFLTAAVRHRDHDADADGDHDADDRPRRADALQHAALPHCGEHAADHDDEAEEVESG